MALPFTSSRDRVAVAFGPDRLRLLVGRGNGHVEGVHEDAEALPDGALRATLRAPAFAAPQQVESALRLLQQRAQAAGHLRRAPGLVTLVLPDAAVKIAAAPIDGPAPKRAEGTEIARWVLRDLLPMESEAQRIDWTVIEPAREGDSRWLLALGADAALVREHEAMVGKLGWKTGRVLPWSLAARAGAGKLAEQGLVLCEGDGALSCLFESAAVVRFHRAWRARVDAAQLEIELPSLQRYVADRIEVEAARAVLCGSGAWCEQAAATCASAGLATVTVTPASAMTGALRT